MASDQSHRSGAGVGGPRHRRRLEVLMHHIVAPEASDSPLIVRGDLRAKKTGIPVVIGGMVLDIQASPSSHELQPGTTTPGQVCYVRGGVGRNVAECLARLDAPAFFISMVGDDMAGDLLLEHWCSLGLEVKGIRRCDGVSTPVVSAVFDGRGELAAAVADTHAIEEHLTPKWIERFAAEIQSAPAVLLDANLHPFALRAACKLASDAGVPVWFEPVSVAKSVRATDLLSSITFISPNEAELVAMSEALHNSRYKKGTGPHHVILAQGNGAETVGTVLGQELQVPIRELLEAGVKFIVLTLGSKGAVLCSTDGSGQISYHHYPALPTTVVKLSGAGDCLVAGALAALSNNLAEVQALAYGVAAAKMAVESDMNVPQELSWIAVAEDARTLLTRGEKLVTA